MRRSHMMMFLILCFLLGLGINHVMGDEALIIGICSKTPFKNLCISALKSDPGSARADTPGLGVIIVKQFAGKTQSATGIVKQRLNTEKDPKVVDALRQCVDFYNVVTNALVSSCIQAFSYGNPKFAEQGATQAAGTVDSCEEGFPRGRSPVSGLNKEISQLAQVAAAIARQLL